MKKWISLAICVFVFGVRDLPAKTIVTYSGTPHTNIQLGSWYQFGEAPLSLLFSLRGTLEANMDLLVDPPRWGYFDSTGPVSWVTPLRRLPKLPPCPPCYPVFRREVSLHLVTDANGEIVNGAFQYDEQADVYYWGISVGAGGDSEYFGDGAIHCCSSLSTASSHIAGVWRVYPTTVPEPSALILLLVGIVALVFATDPSGGKGWRDALSSHFAPPEAAARHFAKKWGPALPPRVAGPFAITGWLSGVRCVFPDLFFGFGSRFRSAKSTEGSCLTPRA